MNTYRIYIDDKYVYTGYKIYIKREAVLNHSSQLSLVSKLKSMLIYIFIYDLYVYLYIFIICIDTFTYDLYIYCILKEHSRVVMLSALSVSRRLIRALKSLLSLRFSYFPAGQQGEKELI